MDVVFNELDNVIDPRRPYTQGGSLNMFLRERVCALLVAEQTECLIELNDHQRFGMEIAMCKNSFLEQVYKAYTKLMVPTIAFAESKTPAPGPFRNPKAVINLLAVIFGPSECNPTPLDRLTALNICYSLNPSYSVYTGRELYPYNYYSHMIRPITVTDCRVEDFQGVNLLKMKASKSNLCHTIEPFFLLKDEINKIEDGLWEKLKNRINHMFETATHYDFLTSALMFLSELEPHYSDTLLEKIEDDHLLEEFMNPPVVHAYDNLARRFSLDCHCESNCEDWKQSILSKLLERIFMMRAP